MRRMKRFKLQAGKPDAISRKNFMLLSMHGLAALSLGGVTGCTKEKNTNNTSRKLIGHVVSHTHWDRSWYLPFEQFRLRLVQLIQKLLVLMEKDPEYKFCMDGQTLILEDYLEIYPQDLPRIKKLVQRKQLAVGPFYCQPDQFLISGESLIRNMMIGIAQAESFGPVQMEGLLGDNFGHISQLPQLFKGFGIRSLFTSATRGIPRDKLKNGWVQRFLAPDDTSSVPAYFFGENYANFYYWGFDNFNPEAYPTLPPDATEWSVGLAEKKLEEVLKVYREGNLNTSQLFLGNGVDHQEAQPHVPQLIKTLNGSGVRDVILVHSSLEELMDAVLAENAELPELKGPLGDDKLFGTMTSRVYLKQSFARIAATTEMLTEPLLALADIFGQGHRAFRETHHYAFTFNPGQNWAGFPFYPQGQIKHLWKLMLQNAPHDDICGCSVDATHQDMENRFKRADEITTLLWQDAFLVLARRLVENEVDDHFPRLVVFNPHPFRTQERLEFKLSMPGVFDPGKIRLTDEKGAEVDHLLVKAQIKEYPQWDGNDFNRKNMFKGIEATLAINPVLDPCSFSLFRVDDRAVSASSSVDNSNELPRLTENDGSVEVENTFYHVRIRPDGAFDLRDKELNASWEGLGKLEDVEDAGDGYSFRRLKPPAPAADLKKMKGALKVLRHDRVSTLVEVSLNLELPAGLDRENNCRSKETVFSPLKMTYEIFHYRKGGKLTCEFENRAKDHHLQLFFPTGIDAESFSYDSKFDFASYPVGYEKARLDSVALVSAPEKSFALVVDCPTIIASRKDETGEVELGWSIVRAVDHVNAGIPLEYWNASESQCLRKITRNMEWCTGNAGEIKSRALKLKRTLLIPPACLALDVSGKYSYLDTQHTELPLASGSSLEIEGENVHLSAWKKAENSEGWIIRVFNLGDEEEQCRIKTSLPVRDACITDLSEKYLDKLPGSAEAGFSCKIGAKEIKTLRLVPDERILAAGIAEKGKKQST